MTTDRTKNRLGWIKRRARRIQRFYDVSRRVAVFDAALDYVSFCGLELDLRRHAVEVSQ